MQITDLIDLGKFVPNLNVTAFSAGHTASANVFIRGIGLQDHLIATDPGVGVYVDGVYLGRQVGQNWSLANIDRVEVLRGPQGVSFGRNSIGGAIHIITRRPGDDEGGRATLQIGSRNRLNGEFYTNNRLSDDVALSVTGAFRRRDGIGEFQLLDNPRKEVGELQDTSARVALLWTPSDRFSLLLTGDGNSSLPASAMTTPPMTPTTTIQARGNRWRSRTRPTVSLSPPTTTSRTTSLEDSSPAIAIPNTPPGSTTTASSRTS
jgi:iron complex outermembrane receptor protein